jgi:hypothetical protein
MALGTPPVVVTRPGCQVLCGAPVALRPGILTELLMMSALISLWSAPKRRVFFSVRKRPDTAP